MRYLVIIFLLTLNGLVWLWGHDHLRSVGLPAPSLSTDASSERPNDAKAAKAAAEAAAETDGALAPDAARELRSLHPLRPLRRPPHQHPPHPHPPQKRQPARYHHPLQTQRASR